MSSGRYSLRGSSGVVRESGPSPLIDRASSELGNELHCPDGSKEQDCDIKHGILLSYTIRMTGRVKTVLYYPRKQSYTVLHSQHVYRYTQQELLDQLPLNAEGKEDEVERLLHAAEYGVYVGVCKHRLVLFDKNFQSLHQTECEEQISTGAFNHWSGELITAGLGYFKTWTFRKGAKELAPSVTYTNGLLPNENITSLNLESVPGKAQRVFASIGRSLKIFLLETGRLLEYLKDIHTRPISAVMFFRPLRLLLTAARDGSIKVWDSARNLCYAFIGHKGAVTDLAPYPYGPMAISSSLDCTLRVWDLTSYNQVQIVDHTLPVEGMSCEPGVHQILTYSSKQVKVWLIQQLYSRAAHVGSSSLSLLPTSHPLVPTRVLAACADSAVRVISPVSGDVLTTALLPVDRHIQSVCYFSFKETLYVLDDKGSISVFNMRENPAVFKTRWSSPRILGKYRCLALYETAMDEEEIGDLLESDRWLAVSIEARSMSHRRQMGEEDPLKLLREGQSLLIVGTSRGYLVILDPRTGAILCSMHGETGISGEEKLEKDMKVKRENEEGKDEEEDKVNKEEEDEEVNEVLVIACNSGKGQVVTAGKAATVYIWELHPHTKEPLDLVFSFPLACAPSLMVSSRDRLAIACNDVQTSSYAIHLFNIADRETYSAHPESSHDDVIVGLDVAHKMKLFASCSLDRTVRIWTEYNIPVRVLHLDSPAEGLVFCSQQADILIAIHSHLHTIANFTYFTMALHKQLMSTRLSEPVKETQLPWSDKISFLPPQDMERLDLVDNIISEDAYRGDLSEEEMAALEEAARIKALALAKISNREEEIIAIADGLLLSSKKCERSLGPLTGRDKEEMWNALLKQLRPGEPRLTISLPLDLDFDLESNDTDGRRDSSPFSKGPSYKFFPPLATFQPPYSVAPDGCLPNSMLLQNMRKSDADKEMASSWVPPSLSEAQRRLMDEMKLEEEEDDVEVEEDMDAGGAMMSRLQAALSRDVPSSIPSSPSPLSTPSPPPTPPRKVVETLRELPKKVVPKKKSPPPPKPVTPPPPASFSPPPSPSPPPTPLPEYIAQFIGQSWFDELFPNPTSKTFPKPWTISSFILKLLSFLPRPLVAISTKTAILQSILRLLGSTHSPHTSHTIYNTVLDLLQSKPMLSTTIRAQRSLVLQAFHLLFDLDHMDNQLVVILLHHYVEGDSEVQTLVMDYLIKHGMVDPGGYFQSAMRGIKKRHSSLSLGSEVEGGEEEKEEEEEDVFLTIPTAKDTPSTELVSMVHDWLESWTEEFSWSTHSKSAASKKPTKKALKSSVASTASSSTKKVGFKLQETKSSPSSSQDSLQPINVINYFIKQEHAKFMAKKESPVHIPAPEPEEEDHQPRNTVLRLPHINKRGVLTRLGETHQSCCHPERESAFPLLLRQHLHHRHCYQSKPSDRSQLWNQFTHSLTLTLVPKNINPFLTEEEKVEEEEMRLRKRTSFISDSRYFIHRHSYIGASNDEY